MSPTKRRQRRERPAARADAAPAAASPAPDKPPGRCRTCNAVPVPGASFCHRCGSPVTSLPPLPVWRWRTFPVYAGLVLGGFIGMYMGFVAGLSDNQTLSTVVFVIWATLLGFAVSKLFSRLLITRRWIKPRPRR